MYLSDVSERTATGFLIDILILAFSGGIKLAKNLFNALGPITQPSKMNKIVSRYLNTIFFVLLVFFLGNYLTQPSKSCDFENPR